MENKTLSKTEAKFSEESSMEDSPVERAEENSDFPSPVLNSVPLKMLPKEETACLRCPNGIWMALTDSVQCFCRLTNAVTSSTDSENSPLMCDGTLLLQENG